MNENELKNYIGDRMLFKFDDKPRLGINVGVLKSVHENGVIISLLYPIDTYQTECWFKFGEVCPINGMEQWMVITCRWNRVENVTIKKHREAIDLFKKLVEDSLKKRWNDPKIDWNNDDMDEILQCGIYENEAEDYSINLVNTRI